MARHGPLSRPQVLTRQPTSLLVVSLSRFKEDLLLLQGSSSSSSSEAMAARRGLCGRVLSLIDKAAASR